MYFTLAGIPTALIILLMIFGDTSPSFLEVLAQSFASFIFSFWVIVATPVFIQPIAYNFTLVVCGILAVELMQVESILPNMYYDHQDMLFSILGIVLGFFTLDKMKLFNRDKPKQPWEK